jgi:hypothetical protein
MRLCCRAGLYKLPWDMTTPGHRQTNPLFVLQKVCSFVQHIPSSFYCCCYIARGLLPRQASVQHHDGMSC